MITKPDLIKVLIKEYDNLIDIYSSYMGESEYYENHRLHKQEGRVNAFKECILGQTEQEYVSEWSNSRTTSIKDVNEEIARELKEGQK